MFFDGDHRTRRRKVKLGGRSVVEDRSTVLLKAKQAKEARKRQRMEQEAATVIGAFARSWAAAKSERARVREVWVSRPVGLEARLLSVRQLVFFYEKGSASDALRLCSACEGALESLAASWLDETRCAQEGRLPNLCHLLIARSFELLDGLAELGDAEVAPRAVESVLPFLEACLGLHGGLGPGASAAVSRTLSHAVHARGLYASLAKLLACPPSDLPRLELTRLEGFSASVVGKCLGLGLSEAGLADFLTLEGSVFGEGGVLSAVAGPLWEGLVAVASGSPAGAVDGALARRGGGEGVHAAMLNNFLALSRSRRGGMESGALGSFIGLLDALLAPCLGSGEPGGEGLPQSAETAEVVSILAGDLDMWNALSKSILPGSREEILDGKKLEGTVALVSLLSKLVAHCGDAQPLVVLLTSLAFKVHLLERLWFYASASLDPTSISDQDQDRTADFIVVLCTVHVLRLQIISDREHYQHDGALMGSQDLDGVVVFIKNFVSCLVDGRGLEQEDLEGGDRLGWRDRLCFLKATDHLDKLHEQNGRHRLVSEESFHLEGLKADDAFLREADAGGRAGLVCQRCPYFLPFHDRVRVFRHFLERDREAFYSGLPPQVRMNPFLSAKTVTIRRKYVLEDGYAQLDPLGPGLKAIVRIQFVNELGEDEAGVDGGGLFKDFLESLAATAFDTQYGFFRANPENKLYPNPNSSSVSQDHLNFFRFFGRMIGKAVYEGILVDVPFAEFFLRKIRGKRNDFDDLRFLDQELHSNLCFLRGYEGSVEDLGLCFAVERDDFGRVVVEDLVPGGKDEPVTNATAIRYIHLMADYKLNVQMQRQVTAFMQGLQDLLDPEWLNLFNDSELQSLISGSEKGLDLEDMRRNMAYSGGYDENHPVIKTFWHVVGGFTVEEQQKLLKFVTACSRPPLLGFSFLEPSLCIQRAAGAEGDCSRLPTAATCMNLLKLPPYPTVDEMDEKIRYAINSGSGFDLS